jgi:hypothetical protein
MLCTATQKASTSTRWLRCSIPNWGKRSANRTREGRNGRWGTVIDNAGTFIRPSDRAGNACAPHLGRPRTGPSNNWLDARLGTFPRPEVPACAMTLPLLAHAGFVLHVWGESLESAMKVPVPLRLDAQSSVGLETQHSAKVAWFTESSTTGTTALF